MSGDWMGLNGVLLELFWLSFPSGSCPSTASRQLTLHGASRFFLKQSIWIGVGFLAFLIISSVDYHRLARVAYILYAVGIVLLVVVLLVGKSSRGSQRWIPLGPFVMQPSEFVKFPLILVLSVYYSTKARQGWLQRVIVPGLLALPGFALILKQPDLGSSLSFFAIFF